MEVVDKLKEVLSTITEESQNAVIKKCVELGYNIDRGEISLNESFYNLNQSKEILDDAIEHDKLTQLPISIQKMLLTALESVNANTASLISGSDEITNIVNSIEQLYMLLWQYNIHNFSDEHLGYAKKMNQLKNELTEAKALGKELEVGLDLKGKLSKIVEEYESKANEMQGILTNSLKNSSEVKVSSLYILFLYSRVWLLCTTFFLTKAYIRFF